MGKCNTPNKADHENQLCQSTVEGTLGIYNPESLLHTMWYYTTKLLGFKGFHEARQLKWGDFTNINDENNEIRYIQRNEWETKSRNGTDSSNRAFSPKPFPDEENPDRCPVRAYLAYRDH